PANPIHVCAKETREGKLYDNEGEHACAQSRFLSMNINTSVLSLVVIQSNDNALKRCSKPSSNCGKKDIEEEEEEEEEEEKEEGTLINSADQNMAFVFRNPIMLYIFAYQ
ncbi:hypothetical protein PanWU01x14_044960, partial [Parasponia andersonii]